jgi:glycosyltransferase involved in cell wall biosynthesis
MVIDGETGILVEPANPTLLAGALRRLVVDEPMRRAMGSAGRMRAHREFSLDRMISNYEKFYGSLVGGRLAQAQ